MNLRENIKKELRLLNEQSGCPGGIHNYRGYISSTFHNVIVNPSAICTASGTGALSFEGIPGSLPPFASNHCANNQNAYQWLGSPNPGDFVGIEGLGGQGNSPANQPARLCWEYLGTTSSTNLHQTNPILTNPLSLGTFNDCEACDGGTSSSSGCDPSAWSNHSNWITTWTSLPNFTSSNPNQPCNMICNKLQIWNNNLTNAGPVQANQLECKIEEGENQSQIHGCNC
tara:strand:- start:682 stop:1365 length:684 start_codon:yes stop_codon:yes gene_type:complete